MKMIKNYRRKSMIKELFALVGWSLLRHKYLLPVFTLTQVFLSLAIVYGLALLIPDVNNQTAIYLSSGATTLGIIAVGCVLLCSNSKYSKTGGHCGLSKDIASFSVEHINFRLYNLGNGLTTWGVYVIFSGIFKIRCPN